MPILHRNNKHALDHPKKLVFGELQDHRVCSSNVFNYFFHDCFQVIMYSNQPKNLALIVPKRSRSCLPWAVSNRCDSKAQSRALLCHVSSKSPLNSYLSSFQTIPCTLQTFFNLSFRGSNVFRPGQYSNHSSFPKSILFALSSTCDTKVLMHCGFARKQFPSPLFSEITEFIKNGITFSNNVLLLDKPTNDLEFWWFEHNTELFVKTL